jgi:hypothetical protein
MPDHPWNLSTLPQQDSASQETTGDQEQQNDSPVNSPTGQIGYVFHTSYLSVMHCHFLSVSAAVVLTLVFTIGLAETTPVD